MIPSENSDNNVLKMFINFLKELAFIFICVNISIPMCSYIHVMKSLTEEGVNMWALYIIRCHCFQMYVNWQFDLTIDHSSFLFLITT